MSVKPVYRLNLPAVADHQAVVATVSGGEVRPVTLRVVGDVSHLRAVLRTHHARGTLVEHGIPRRLRDGRYAVDVTILQSATDAACHSGRSRWHRIRLRAAIVAGVVAVSAIAGYGLYLVVKTVLASLPVVAGGLVVLVLIPVAVLGVRAGCKGMHCDGCN